MSDKYILIDKVPTIEKDLYVWANWFESADRIVKKSVWDGVEISTVFLGLDHSFGNGPPLLFETMVFGWPEGEEHCTRYSTWEEAIEGHDSLVEKLWKEKG